MIGAVIGSLGASFGSLGEWLVGSQFDEVDGPETPVATRHWRVKFTLTNPSIVGGTIETDYIEIATGIYDGIGNYYWSGTGEFTATFAVTLVVHTDILCERTIEPETDPDTGDGLPIWANNPGDGLELSKLQGVHYSLAAHEYSWSATLDSESTTFSGADMGGTELLLGLTLAAENTLVGFVVDCDCVGIDLTYTTTRDGQPFSVMYDPHIDDSTRNIAGGYPGTPANYLYADVRAIAMAGGGQLSLRTIKPNTDPIGDSRLPPGYHYTTQMGLVSIIDNCNASLIRPNVQLRYMWDRQPTEKWAVSDGGNPDINKLGNVTGLNDRSRGELQITAHTDIPASLEYDTATGRLQYGKVTSGAMMWKGNYVMRAWGCDYIPPYGADNQFYMDDPPPSEHGPYGLSLDYPALGTNLLRPDGLPVPLSPHESAYAGTTEHMLVPGLAVGQPNHHIWKPWPHVHDPDMEGGDPQDTEPPWYDSSVYLSNQAFLTDDSAFVSVHVIQGVPYKVLTFVDSGDWTASGATMDFDGDLVHIATTEAGGAATITRSQGLAIIHDDKIPRLTGRYARIRWRASHAGATALITFGPHSWLMTANSADWQDTEIDLLCPNITTLTGQMQSILNRERPWEHAWISGSSQRPADDATYTDDGDTYNVFDWDYPAGWGVGRLTNIGLAGNEPDTDYWFDSVSIRHRTRAEGGFARLLVYPHQPWNDTRQLPDAAAPESGLDIYGAVSDDPEVTTNPIRHHYEYIKAVLIVDGAVCAEIAGGRIQYSEADSPVIYNHIEYTTRDSSGTPNYGCVYPHDDYNVGFGATESWSCVKGVSITFGTAEAGNDFQAHTMLVQALYPGVYPMDDTNHISAGYRLMVNKISYTSGLNGYQFWDRSEWRGCGAVCGVAFDGDEPKRSSTVSVATPNASTGRGADIDVPTNRLGWFLSPALNTKAAATVEGVTTDPLRNRVATRMVTNGS